MLLNDTTSKLNKVIDRIIGGLSECPNLSFVQGSPSKSSSKSILRKHGLQSLGRIPTEQLPPANLQNVKPKKGGNDPTVLPTGGSGGTKDGERAGSVEQTEVQNRLVLFCLIAPPPPPFDRFLK